MRNGDNMRLYKTEIYKLCHRKIFIMGIFVILGFLFLDHGEFQAFKANLVENEYGYSQTIWALFFIYYAVTMMGLGAVLLCLLSTVFSHEEETGMKSLLLTTQEGPAKDARAKIAASYTVSIVLWLITTLIVLAMYVAVFGLDGFELSAGDVIWHTIDFDVLAQPLGSYLTEVLLVSFLAVSELCAITLAVSAEYRSTFHSFCVSTLCIFAPVFAFYMIRGSYSILLSNVLGPTVTTALIIRHIILFFIDCLIYSSPFYLVYPNILVEISGIGIMSHGETGTILLVVALGCIVTILCIIKSYRKYRKPYV